MKWVLIVLGVAALLVLCVVAVGAMLPKGHSVTRSAVFKRSPAEVWAAITSVEAFTSWRKGLKKAERLPDENGMPGWSEIDGHGQLLPLRAEVFNPPTKMVTRIADPKLPFGGTWTWVLAPEGDGCRITITEDGEVYNPVFRFVSRFIMGHSATLDGYMKSLEEHLVSDIPSARQPDA